MSGKKAKMQVPEVPKVPEVPEAPEQVLEPPTAENAPAAEDPTLEAEGESVPDGGGEIPPAQQAELGAIGEGIGVTVSMWHRICEQYEHVKAAMRDFNAAKIEASACRKDLDSAQARLGTLIEQAERGQTELFDVGAPVVSTGEGVAAPAGEQAPLFAGGEGEQPTEPESQDDPEGDPASHEATQDSEE